jgi:hypothetical protein
MNENTKPTTDNHVSFTMMGAFRRRKDASEDGSQDNSHLIPESKERSNLHRYYIGVVTALALLLLYLSSLSSSDDTKNIQEGSPVKIEVDSSSVEIDQEPSPVKIEVQPDVASTVKIDQEPSSPSEKVSVEEGEKVMARYASCVLPAPPTQNQQPKKTIWMPQYPDSLDDNTMKSLVGGLTGMSSGAKSFYASVKGELRSCKSKSTDTAICMVVHPMIETK